MLTVLDPFTYVQKKPEPDKVIGSLVMPLIWDPRTSLTDVLDDLRDLALDEDEAGALKARAMLLPCVQALLIGFNSCWATVLAQ